MKTATTNGKRLDGFSGIAMLYKLDPPYIRHEWCYGDECEEKDIPTEWVIVSMYSGAETYIFPANSDGTIESWGELEGSERGSASHSHVLANIGYTVVVDEE